MLRKLRDERGQTMAEYVIVTAVLCLGLWASFQVMGLALRASLSKNCPALNSDPAQKTTCVK